MRELLIGTLAFAMCASPAAAQQTTPESTETRPSAAITVPAQESKFNVVGGWIKKAFGGDETQEGFYAELRGLPPGSGIQLGPGYRHSIGATGLVFDASAAASWSRSTFARASVQAPHLAGDRLGVGVEARRQDFTRLNFFGVGPASVESSGTDYRLENTDYSGFVSLKPASLMKVVGRVGYAPSVALARPKTARYPATQDIFTASTAAGLTEQPAFLHSETYIDFDARNHTSRPTSGGNYRLTYSTFRDRDLDRYSFNRLEAEASQFIPILHENWVIALRGRVTRSDTADGNVVPFYLLPTLGGSRSLRGYEDYRFRDRNSLLLNAEYRWKVFDAMDGALFYDTGKVAPRFGDLDFKKLKTSYGVGFRFHSDDTTFLRVDIARSREGTRFLIAMGEVLRPGHGSVLIPYVP